MPLYQVFDLLSPLAAGAEVAVTGATTALIDRWHKVSGTSADYTITLPAAAGNAGRFIGFRVAGAAAASKLYTLDGNSSETIDGATTRVLWAEESAILLCDGSNWFKVGGKSRPMKCKISAAAQQTGIAAETFTVVTLATATLDNTGLMAGSSLITARRAGNYFATLYCEATSSQGATDVDAGHALSVSLNSTSAENWRLVRPSNDKDGIGGGSGAGLINGLVAGDVLRLLAYFGKVSGTPTYSTTHSAPAIVSNLSVVEVPTW